MKLTPRLNQQIKNVQNKNMGTIDEESDDDEDYQVPEADIEVPNVLDQTMNQNP